MRTPEQIKAEIAELLRKLAAYEAQPTLLKFYGPEADLIAKPTTTEHLDWLLAEVRNTTLEEAVRMCERRADSGGGAYARQCAVDICSLKGQP